MNNIIGICEYCNKEVLEGEQYKNPYIILVPDPPIDYIVHQKCYEDYDDKMWNLIKREEESKGKEFTL